MINYVNNSFDNVLKPCDAQKFSTLTQSEQTERLILAHRAGEPKAKGKLPALTYMGVFDKDKYKHYLAKCEAQGTKPLSPRHAEFMRPTGLLMLDFDHVGDPKALYEQLSGKMNRDKLALAHITPSGDGLRLVLKREKGKSIQQEQYDFCQAMEVKCDDVCKDISRLSYAPMKSEILYFNPSLLFGELPEASDYPDGSLFGGDALRATLGNEVRWPQGKATPPSPCDTHDTVVQGTALPSLSTVRHLVDPQKASFAMNRGGVGEVSTHPEGMQSTNCPSVYRGTSTECGGSSKQSAEQYPTDYNGIEYAEIIRRLEEQLGGAPAQGARNSFIFTMACNLRYICNDDAAWVASILPTYGEEPQKHRQTIQSAINRPMSRTMPETLKRALMVSAESVEVSASHSPLGEAEEAFPPAMPANLPEPIALLTSRTPEIMKSAVAMSVFPALGAHLKDTHFAYWDGREYEPTFMNVLVAELSTGKSAVNKPIEYILADIEERDMVHIGQEQEWKAKCARLSSTQERPARPDKLVVQILSSDMTNAAFVQRLADAEGHFLYTQMDEIELLNALRTNGASNMVSAVLRLAFDCGKYGQERVAANAINAKVRVRWNWNASTTVQRVRKFFAKNIADGTLSRLSFSTIIKPDDDWGDKSKPRYGAYGEEFAKALKPYIDRLNVCSGTIHCPEAATWADHLGDELIAFAKDADDRSYAQFSFRAVLMGFFRAMVLYVMNGMQWTREIEEFATWSVRYDMWCKMRFFRDMMHLDLEGERSAIQRGPVGLLAMLPREFTREQVRDLRIKQGMSSDPANSIKNWKRRGLITLDEDRRLYVKCNGVSVGVN